MGEKTKIAVSGSGCVLLVGAALTAYFGALCLLGWIADAAYSSAFEPDAPSIDYWPMVGLMFIVLTVAGAIGRSTRDA